MSLQLPIRLVHITLQKDSQMSGSVITCNDIPLVRETVSLPGNSSASSATVQETETIDDDDDFVYDVYRTDDDQFDFQSLEDVLAIQAFRFSDLFNSYMFRPVWGHTRVFSDTLCTNFCKSDLTLAVLVVQVFHCGMILMCIVFLCQLLRLHQCL